MVQAMRTVVYNIPVHLVPAYQGQEVIVRAQDPTALVQALPDHDLEKLVSVQLLSLSAAVDVLADWGYGVPVELIMRSPDIEFPLLYRHAKLLDKHPVRVSIPALPGLFKAVKVASALRFPVKLEVGQPEPETIEALQSVLEFYLHHPSVSQPVEFFHTSLLSFYNQAPVSLWDVQEEDPVYVRYVMDDGRETIARRPVSRQVTGDLGVFITDLQQKLLAEHGECCACEFLAHCGSYFKWPRKDYGCSGVKTLFRTLRDAGAALRHDLNTFTAARKGTGQ
jgi:hypothetical protein